MTYTTTTREGRDAIAERLKALAIEFGLSDAYHARVTWANESGSVYLSLPMGRKIRIADHGAAYGCSISVDPEGLTVEQAEQWLRDEAADEEPEMSLEELEAMLAR